MFYKEDCQQANLYVPHQIVSGINFVSSGL